MSRNWPIIPRYRFIILGGVEPGAGILRQPSHYDQVRGWPRIFDDDSLDCRGHGRAAPPPPPPPHGRKPPRVRE